MSGPRTLYFKMFDLIRTKNSITDHFYRVLQCYKNPNLLKPFIQQWLQLVTTYSEQPHFLSFDPPVPVIHRLVPNAVGVLVVPFPNTNVPARLRRVSIFPLYPFKINYSHHTHCSREGIDILISYLELSGIKLVGFFKVPHAQKLIPQLQERLPDVKFYGPSVFSSFQDVCHLAFIKKR